MVLLLLSGACGEAPKGDNGGGSNGVAVETATEDTTEPIETDNDKDETAGDPGESGDSEGDTGEDTASLPPIPDWAHEPMNPDWRGGDPVPGWEDRYCPDREGPDVLHLDYRTDGVVILVIGHTVGTDEPARLAMSWFEPTDFVPRDGEADYVFDLRLMIGSDGAPESGTPTDFRSVGWYAHSAASHRITSRAIAITPFDILLPVPGGHDALATCVTYIGPDRFAGSVYLAPYAPPGQNDARSPYDAVTWQLDFEYVFHEHAGSEDDYPGIPNWEYWTQAVEYYRETSYLEAWPWTEITDPGVRAAMFWRYMPANDPRYLESLRRTGVRP